MVVWAVEEGVSLPKEETDEGGMMEPCLVIFILSDVREKALISEEKEC